MCLPTSSKAAGPRAFSDLLPIAAFAFDLLKMVNYYGSLYIDTLGTLRHSALDGMRRRELRVNNTQ